MSGRIRGEYWIQGGQVDFADGDTGDRNHEMVAVDHVCSQHLSDIYGFAEELNLERLPSLWSMEDEPASAVWSLMSLIQEKLSENSNGRMGEKEIWSEVAKRCGIDDETMAVMMQGSESTDPRLYVMKKYGWIAVRSDNVELFGYDQRKAKELADGLEEILDQEGVEEPDEEIDFSLYDHKTGRTSTVTLADIKEGGGARPQTLPNTTYNRPILAPPDRSKPMGSQSPRYMDLRTKNAMQTSEGNMGFRDWLSENCEPLIVRRSWPFLTGVDEAGPARRSSRRDRRGRRR